MCANFKPLTLAQVQQFGLPEIPFDYVVNGILKLTPFTLQMAK